MPEPSLRPPLLGRIIYGYRVDEVIGSGSQGEVYRLTHPTLPGKSLALKVLRGENAASHELRSRFLQDAMAAAKVGSTGVVQPIQIDELPDGTPYIVMELAPGRSLDLVLAERGPLPTATAVGIAADVAATMTEVHRRGIIHRDLKPGNVMVDLHDDEVRAVKLLDFGVALVSGDIKRVKTAKGQFFGTRFYIAPETSSGDPIDGRVDVFSLGVVLFEMLTGDAPFPGLFETLSPEPAPAAGTRRPSRLDPVPPSVEKAIAGALAKRASARLTMAELRDQLHAALAELPAPEPSQRWRETLKGAGASKAASPPMAQWPTERLERSAFEEPTRDASVDHARTTPDALRDVAPLPSAPTVVTPARPDPPLAAGPTLVTAPAPKVAPPTERLPRAAPTAESAPDTEETELPPSRTHRTIEPPRSRRATWLAFGAVAIGGIAAAGMVVLALHRHPAETAGGAVASNVRGPDRPARTARPPDATKPPPPPAAAPTARVERPPRAPEAAPRFFAVETGTREPLFDCATDGQGGLWAVGAHGVVLRSTDGGRTVTHRDWDEPAAPALYGVWADGAGGVWAVGDRGTILHASDGGDTWSRQSSGAGASVLTSVWGSSASDLYVVGNPSLVLHSGDGGARWQREPTHNGNGLRRVWGTAAGHAFTVGWGETILRTLDGRTWSELRRGTSVTLFDVWGSGGDVWAVGSLHPPGSRALGADDALLHSTDGGRSFAMQPGALRLPLYAVGGTGPRDIYLGGPAGALWRSTDGATFARLEAAAPHHKVNRICAGRDGEVFVVGMEGMLLRGE